MSIGSAFFSNWNLINLDTDQVLEGDFEAENVTRNVSVSFVDHHTLSKESPITQYLHGNSDTLSFDGRFFVDPAVFSLTGLPFGALGAGVGLVPDTGITGRYSLRPSEKMEILEKWASVDPDLNRPAIVLFSIGDGELSQTSVIESISNIVYDRPLLTGEIRGISFSLTLKQFVPFDIDLANLPPPRTRYHHTKAFEYYELLAASEYGDPLLGDVVRKEHPDQSILYTGDVVKLPSLAAIQSTSVIPRSIPFMNLESNVASEQRTLRKQVIDRLNVSRFSTVIPDGL